MFMMESEVFWVIPYNWRESTSWHSAESIS